jgi:hypothetical protein
MKPQYESGKTAREKFERTMTALFRAPKTAVKKSTPKKRGASEK